jgi:hypothetical protein
MIQSYVLGVLTTRGLIKMESKSGSQKTVKGKRK